MCVNIYPMVGHRLEERKKKRVYLVYHQYTHHQIGDGCWALFHPSGRSEMMDDDFNRSSRSKINFNNNHRHRHRETTIAAASLFPSSSTPNRKRPVARSAGGLTEFDRLVLNAIKSKGEAAISDWSIKKETNLPVTVVNKCIKNLKELSLVKEIRHANFKGKHYIAAEFEPADEVTGGVWFNDGVLDTNFIDQLKGICLKIIKQLKVATADGVSDFFKKHRLTKTECTSQQISEILRTLVLDNAIIEVKSTGLGDYYSIPIGNVCYRCLEGNLRDQGPKIGAMVSIPCGVCPRMRQCAPDGRISPTTCVYYTKWLDF